MNLKRKAESVRPEIREKHSEQEEEPGERWCHGDPRVWKQWGKGLREASLRSSVPPPSPPAPRAVPHRNCLPHMRSALLSGAGREWWGVVREELLSQNQAGVREAVPHEEDECGPEGIS